MANFIKEINTFNSFQPKFIKSMNYLIFDNIPVTTVLCEFDSILYSDSLAIKFLGIDLFEKISNAVNARKSEFLAGRFLAAYIINRLGFSNLKVDVRTNRMPVWPDNIKGSISHVNRFAVCAVSACKSITRIGIDIELLNQETTSDLINTVMSEDEILFANTTGFNSAYIFSLFFSAKESLFKALYPEVNFYFDFDAARIISIDIEEMIFTISLNYSLSSIHKKGMTYNGRYIIMDTHIITIIY